MTRASDIRTQNFNQPPPLIQMIFWLIYFYDKWLFTRTNNWFAMTLVWNTQMINHQIKCMFWWKHEIKICSCWWIMTPTFWGPPTKLNDIDNHHSWSSLQVWMPNKYRQVDLIFQWHIRPTDGIQHVAEYLFYYWPMPIMKGFLFWIFLSLTR